MFFFELEEITSNQQPNKSVVVKKNYPNVNLCARSHSSQKKKEKETALLEEVRRPITPKFSEIKRKAFRAILAPYHLVNIVKEIFVDVSIIPISAIERTLREEPLISVLSNKEFINQRVIGPHYLRGLMIFKDQFPQVTKLGVHLIRLPFTPLDGSIENSLNLKVYNEMHWRGFYLRRALSKRQLNSLQSCGDGKSVKIFYKEKNIYIVFCRPHLVQTLRDVIAYENKQAKKIQICYRHYSERKAALFFKKERGKIILQKKLLEESERALLSKTEELREKGAIQFRKQNP